YLEILGCKNTIPRSLTPKLRTMRPADCSFARRSRIERHVVELNFKSFVATIGDGDRSGWLLDCAACELLVVFDVHQGNRCQSRTNSVASQNVGSRMRTG